MENIRQLSPKQLNLTENFDLSFPSQIDLLKEIEKDILSIDFEDIDIKANDIESALSNL
jgi:hypothetical protein